MLGQREPSIYGNVGFEEYLSALRAEFPQYEIVYAQSNIEGEIVNLLQQHAIDSIAILLNAGGYTHTSVAIHDAIKAVGIPVIEIHISNIAAREDFRRTSIIGAACKGSIAGFGLNSYRLGILAINSL